MNDVSVKDFGGYPYLFVMRNCFASAFLLEALAEYDVFGVEFSVSMDDLYFIVKFPDGYSRKKINHVALSISNRLAKL